jgi:MurE/MurF fusion protein
MSEVRHLLAELNARGVVPTGVADDSRQVEAGDLFLAYPKYGADGRVYIADALRRGAVAVVQEADGAVAVEAVVPVLTASALRTLVAPLAHAIHEYPSDRLAVLAVTGTNGKTTVSQWLAQAYPRRCAVIGTLGVGFPPELDETGFTTPEATTLAHALARFSAAGAAACALEASSIGIAEGRMDEVRVDTAIFTNFTRDHLDYHGSMEAYAAEKARLFTWPHLRLAVINVDDEFGRRLLRTTTAARILACTVGEAPVDCAAVIRAQGLVATPLGQHFTLVAPNGRVEVDTRVLGRYNIANLLAVAAVLIDAGVALPAVAGCLARLAPPPGRMEVYGGEGEPLVAVDYAHTPDALAQVLAALREVAQARGGRLHCLFGCGGDRDRGKRPLMGEVATRSADQVWLTSDNPRSEDPLTILADIRAGAPAAPVCADRAEAIRQALAAAAPQDVLLVAGKGHETYQEIQGVRHAFHDGSQVMQALAALKQNGVQA